ncbi:helix-turn-helix domain-containing protein [Roseomonas chloroacetimidivorans]|uniref:helix-turn-helix domain-containing protein n=1 Tax=Roseomonas chloroacetimidivorans TaxID=1766656 RepID=UPI003C74C8A8
MGNDEVARLLGSRVRAHRERAGLTQQALARLAKVQQGQLSEIETADRVPTLSTIRKIAAALEVPLRELLDG